MLDLTTPDILRERCDCAYRRILPAVAGALVLALVLGACLWRSRPVDDVLFWQSARLVLAAALGALGWAYRRSKDAAEQPELWARRLVIGAAALGAGWGSGAAAFF